MYKKIITIILISSMALMTGCKNKTSGNENTEDVAIIQDSDSSNTSITPSINMDSEEESESVQENEEVQSDELESSMENFANGVLDAQANIAEDTSSTEEKDTEDVADDTSEDETINKENPDSSMTYERFEKIMSNRGYTTMDISDLLLSDNSDLLGTAIMASSYEAQGNNQICIVFCELATKEYASSLYDTLYMTINSQYELEKIGYVGDDPCGYYKDEQTDEEMFYLFSIKDNTIMYATSTVDEKETVKNTFAEFEY